MAEGEDLLAAADAAGWDAVERYCAAGSGLGGIEVDGELLARASGLASGTRALAVYEERWASAAVGPLCVYLHGVHDPGNLGTILRSAEAFGVASVALGRETADPFSPKAVRASMGAVFTVSLVKADDPSLLPGVKIALVPGEGVALGALWRSGSAMPDQNAKELAEHPPASLTLLLGSEREGLPREIAGQADHIAHIPIVTDSLNVAMAATVALYELANRMAHHP